MVVYKKRHKKKNKFKLIFIIFLIFIFIFAINGNKLFSNSFKSKEENPKQKEYLPKNSVFPDEVFNVPVYTDLVEINTEARPGTKRIIKNFSKGVGAYNHAIYLKNNNHTSTSWHYTVDDHEIYHHIPDDEIAHHAGDASGNEYGIGIELCVNSDGNFERTLNNAAKLVAYLLNAYDLDIDNVKTHHDFSGKDCPHNILKNNRFSELLDKIENYL